MVVLSSFCNLKMSLFMMKVFVFMGITVSWLEQQYFPCTCTQRLFGFSWFCSWIFPALVYSVGLTGPGQLSTQWIGCQKYIKLTQGAVWRCLMLFPCSSIVGSLHNQPWAASSYCMEIWNNEKNHFSFWLHNKFGDALTLEVLSSWDNVCIYV